MWSKSEKEVTEVEESAQRIDNACFTMSASNDCSASNDGEKFNSFNMATLSLLDASNCELEPLWR